MTLQRSITLKGRGDTMNSYIVEIVQPRDTVVSLIPWKTMRFRYTVGFGAMGHVLRLQPDRTEEQRMSLKWPWPSVADGASICRPEGDECLFSRHPVTRWITASVSSSSALCRRYTWSTQLGPEAEYDAANFGWKFVGFDAIRVRILVTLIVFCALF